MRNKHRTLLSLRRYLLFKSVLLAIINEKPKITESIMMFLPRRSVVNGNGTCHFLTCFFYVMNSFYKILINTVYKAI